MSDLADYISDADLPVAERFDVYPEIDPSQHFVDRTYEGKVVLITGVSRGIGKELAITYARAGAPHPLFPPCENAGGSQAGGPPCRSGYRGSNRRHGRGRCEAGRSACEGGHRPLWTARRGHCERRKADRRDAPLGEQDPFEWWSVLEVNFRGTHSLAHFTLPHLAKANRYFVAISSFGAELCLPNGSAYCLSKQAVNRLVEFVALGDACITEVRYILMKPSLEYPNVKAFAIHPGVVLTEMNIQSAFKPQHAIGLPLASTVYLTSGVHPSVFCLSDVGI